MIISHFPPESKMKNRFAFGTSICQFGIISGACVRLCNILIKGSAKRHPKRFYSSMFASYSFLAKRLQKSVRSLPRSDFRLLLSELLLFSFGDFFRVRKVP
jgi:hypothetical protein